MRQTRQKIRTAVLDLCREKRFTEITAIEASKRAGVARSTFYSHYSDPGSVIEEIGREILDRVDELTADIVANAPTAASDGYSASFYAANYRYYAYLHENRDVLNILNSRNGDPRFVLRRIQQSESISFRVVQAMHISKNNELVASCVTNSLKFIVRQWLSEYAETSVDDVVDISFEMVWNPLLRMR